MTREDLAALVPHEFAGTRTAGYLDTATYGVPPAATALALQEAVRGWRSWEDSNRWEADGEACRRLFADIVGVPQQNVALLPAVSAAAGIVAASLPARAGDNVVCFEREFQSTLFPWLALESRGVTVRLAPLRRLHEAVDRRTRLVAVSTVQSADGSVADLDALRRSGAPIFLDGTQSVGMLPLDLDGVDFLAVAAYKWLLSPRGLTFLYVRGERLASVEAWLAGWKSVANLNDLRYYGPPRDLTPDARRLDTSLPWFVAVGAHRSLALIASVGIDQIAAHNLELARRFCRDLSLPEPQSAIVAVQRPDAGAAAARLRNAGIRCAVRAGSLRFGFHLYNDVSDVSRAVSALRAPR